MWKLMTALKETQEMNLESQQAILDSYQRLLTQSGNREERLAKLLAAKDAVTFQALTAVMPIDGYDESNDFVKPADDADKELPSEEDPISEYEQQFLNELGLDAEFF
jgi:hypothetical protein